MANQIYSYAGGVLVAAPYHDCARCKRAASGIWYRRAWRCYYCFSKLIEKLAKPSQDHTMPDIDTISLAEAEARISKILSQVEKQFGALVQAIEIRDVEVTTMDDARRQIRRRPVIILQTVPGSNWG